MPSLMPASCRVVVVLVLRGAEAKRGADGATDRDPDVVGGSELQVAVAARVGRRDRGMSWIAVGDSGKQRAGDEVWPMR